MFLSEESRFSLRRFIAFSWTLVIIIITIGVTFLPEHARLPEVAAFLTPVTLGVWMFYFGKSRNGEPGVLGKVVSALKKDSEYKDGVKIKYRKINEDDIKGGE